MSHFVGLLKKDYRVGRKGILVSLIFSLILIVGSYFLAVKYDEAPIMLIFSSLLIGFQSIYLGLYVLSSLNAESKHLHLWLHNPISATKLLLSKLLNGFLAFTISLAVSLLYGGYAMIQSLSQYDLNVNNWGALFKVIAIGVFYLINTAIYISVWIILGWVVYKLLKPIIGKLSILIIIISYFLLETVINNIVNTQIFYTITGWGELPIISQRDLVSIFSTPPDGLIGNVPFIYVGQYLFYVLISVGIFYLASWLLDRKVEV